MATALINWIPAETESEWNPSQTLTGREAVKPSLKVVDMPANAPERMRRLHRRRPVPATTPDFTDRNDIVVAHLPLVKTIALRVHESLPVHVELDDLIHAGVLGLIDAAARFDPEKKVLFCSFAKHRIRGAILDSLREADWASRDLRRRHKQMESATRDLSTELQRHPTEIELAERLGLTLERWREMVLELRCVGLVSSSTRPADSEQLPIPEFPSAPDTRPDAVCSREQMRSLLEGAMKVLPERYKKVIVLYYLQEMTMKEIGGVLNINESRVSQIHKSALEKMNGALRQAGIANSRAV